MIHGFGNVIERVREFLRVWPVTVSEARVIGCDKVIVMGEPRVQRFEHPRGRREPVQQEKGRRVFRTSFSVKDGESIYLYRAIRRLRFHGTFLSLGVGWRMKYCEHHGNHQHHTKNLQEFGPTG